MVNPDAKVHGVGFICNLMVCTNLDLKFAYRPLRDKLTKLDFLKDLCNDRSEYYKFLL